MIMLELPKTVSLEPTQNVSQFKTADKHKHTRDIKKQNKKQQQQKWEQPIAKVVKKYMYLHAVQENYISQNKDCNL